MDFFLTYASVVYDNFDGNLHAIFTSLVSTLAFIWVLTYVLQAISLWTIAKKNGFKGAWQALVPFLSTKYIGDVSQKNSTFGVKAKTIGWIAMVFQIVSVAAEVFYFISVYYMLDYIGRPVAQPNGTVLIDIAFQAIPQGYDVYLWMFQYGYDYVLSMTTWFNMLSMVFLLNTFFRTYYPKRYFGFTILSVLFGGVQGICMFLVRNNRPYSYMEYMREQQQRIYQSRYGYDPYAKQQQGNPYQGEDPFGDYASEPKREEEPFDDF